MDLRETYTLRSETPKEGAYACLGLSDVLAQEVSLAYGAGTGPGTPDQYGTLQEGTIPPGSVVMLAADGTWVPGTSALVNAALPIPLFFVHEGTIDLGGRFIGKLVALRGIANFLTTRFNGTSFVPGTALVANAGRFEIKVQGDNKQVVGWVGPLGLQGSRLDVIFEAAVWG